MSKDLKFKDLDNIDKELFNAAILVSKNAYAPYSRFYVGAAASLSSGEIRSGCNFENASYGLSICAEVALLVVINSLGETDKIQKIALVCFSETKPKKKVFITPCGRCRQLFVEMVERIGRDVPILMMDMEGLLVRQSSCKDLLPFSFSEKILG